MVGYPGMSIRRLLGLLHLPMRYHGLDPQGLGSGNQGHR